MSLGTMPLGTLPISYSILDSTDILVVSLLTNINSFFSTTLNSKNTLTIELLSNTGSFYTITITGGIATVEPSLRVYIPKSRTIEFSVPSRTKVFFPISRNTSYTTNSRIG